MPESWWYLKRRRNPSGVLGRPRSPIPLAERRQLARLNYKARLSRRGLRQVRLLLPTADADKLLSLAKSRALSLGQVVTALLRNDAW